MNSLNINAGSLFPGEDGFGQSMSELAQLLSWHYESLQPKPI